MDGTRNWPVWSENVLPVSSTHVGYTSFVRVVVGAALITDGGGTLTCFCVSADGASLTVDVVIGSVGVGSCVRAAGSVSSGGMTCTRGAGCSVALYKKYGDLCTFLVVRRFFRCACMRPRVVAIKDGGTLRSCLTVIWGKVVKKPAEMARAHVSRAGLKSEACMNLIRSFNVGLSMTAFMDATGGRVDVALSIVHKP